jgi:hypothetical protein
VATVLTCRNVGTLRRVVHHDVADEPHKNLKDCLGRVDGAEPVRKEKERARSMRVADMWWMNGLPGHAVRVGEWAQGMGGGCYHLRLSPPPGPLSLNPSHHCRRQLLRSASAVGCVDGRT